jgi:endoglucanase
MYPYGNMPVKFNIPISGILRQKELIMTKLHVYFRYLIITSLLLSGAAQAQTATTAPKMAVSNKNMNLKGVNLSGAEYDSLNLDAKVNYKYTYPSNAEIDYYKSKGFTTIRLPFSGTRLQPVNGGVLSPTELTSIRNVVNYAATKGMYVILDPHDYGWKYDSAAKKAKYMGVAGANGVAPWMVTDFWQRLSKEFKANPNVIFGIMNEPHLQSAKEWRTAAESAIYGIRKKTGASQLILIPGASWTGAHSWIKSGNAAAWADYKGFDGQVNFAFEVHQYLDSDSSGTHATCVAGKGATVLKDITAWARTNRFKLYMGEMGWAQNDLCLKEGADMVAFMSNNADVWTGWAYWGGGKWVKQDYMYMLTPADLKAPVDKPQMKALTDNLPAK